MYLSLQPHVHWNVFYDGGGDFHPEDCRFRLSVMSGRGTGHGTGHGTVAVKVYSWVQEEPHKITALNCYCLSTEG